ncbi:hypothetical protein YC2023_098850 [Brassica napus]
MAKALMLECEQVVGVGKSGYRNWTKELSRLTKLEELMKPRNGTCAFYASKPSSATPSLAMLISSAPSFIVLPPVGLTVPLWSWILWQLWNGRNKLCFENRVFSGMKIISKAIADAREWQSAQCSDKAVPSDVAQSHSRISSLQAPSPSPETVICNVDAAWDSLTLNSGIGGVFSGRKHCP